MDNCGLVRSLLDEIIGPVNIFILMNIMSLVSIPIHACNSEVMLIIFTVIDNMTFLNQSKARFVVPTGSKKRKTKGSVVVGKRTSLSLNFILIYFYFE